MHSTGDSTLDGLDRLGAETDLRMDIKVWMEGEGEGGGGRRGGTFHLGMGRASFLPHLSKMQNGGAGGLEC